MSFSELSSIKKRIISAALLGPLFAAIVWYGSWPLMLWLGMSAFIALHEWKRLSSSLSNRQLLALIAGSLYILLSFYCFYLCRELDGKFIILLLAMVWSSDIGAYFAGKTIGGKKLIPKVSPNKTWAGFFAALISPPAILLCFLIYRGSDVFLDTFVLSLLVFLGVFVGFLSQAGDLLMSAVKRQAKVKDTGTLIPGHGGLLDRIDSLLLVTPCFYIFFKLLSFYIASVN